MPSTIFSGPINSINYQLILPLNDKTQEYSVRPLFDTSSGSYNLASTITMSCDVSKSLNTFWDIDNQVETINTKNGNSLKITLSDIYSGELASYKEHELARIIQQPSGSYITQSFITTISGTIKDPYYTFKYDNEKYRVIPRPQFLYINHIPSYSAITPGASGILYNTYNQYFINNGVYYKTDILSNNSPWDDSYEQFSEILSKLNKKFTVLPEYKASNNINYYIIEKNGDFSSTPPDSYLELAGTSNDYNDISLGYTSTDYFNKFIIDENDYFENKKIKIKINGIKKLLPYKGFYPQERSTQIVNLFADSFFGLSSDEIMTGHIATHTNIDSENGLSGSALDHQIMTVLQPFFAPGILFNTFKSGVAVDWASIVTSSVAYSSSLYPSFYTGSNESNTAFDRYFILNELNKRFDFENILDINSSLSLNEKLSSLYYLNPTFYSSDVVGASGSEGDFRKNVRFPLYNVKYNYNNYNKNWLEKNSLYRLGINNYLSEIPSFFLKDGKLNNFLSKPNKQFYNVISGTTYHMDVYIQRDSSFKTLLDNEIEISGNYTIIPESSYYGPPCAYIDSMTGSKYTTYASDPAYAPYAPPYYYGKSSARLSYIAPISGQVSLKDIVSNIVIEYRNTECDSVFSSSAAGKPFLNSVAYNQRMNIGASINFKQITNFGYLTYDEFGNPITVQDSTDSALDIWSIQTKFECPTLNFNNSLNAVSNEVEVYTELKNFGPPLFLKTTTTSSIGSFSTTGLWSGYGSISEKGKGIVFGIEESFPKNTAGVGSLIELCGFETGQRDIGGMAASKEISEAVVLIPYVEKGYENFSNIEYAKNIHGIVGENGVIEQTRENGPFYFKIEKNILNEVLETQFDTANPEQIKKLLNKTSINKENSIIKTIKSMTDYNIPPHLDWVTNKNIDPFVMYIMEFKHKLDQQDLVDIWQGLMPKIAKSPEIDSSVTEHYLGEKEFFHGKNLPNNIRFKIFKVKKKARKSYYELTDSTSDDTRFRFNFANGKTTPDYSYNWPYDYFSLVEFINVETTSEVHD
jgi:hypothetical protein